MSEINLYLNENNTAKAGVSIISDIVKKPRKPRMSSIVSKAVLFKQLSSNNLITPIIEAIIEKETKDLPLTTRIYPLVIVPIVEERVLSPNPEGKAVEQEVKLSDVVEIPQPDNEEVKKEVLFVGRCDLCDVDFKSVILFNRHTGTIRHKLALHKQAQITSA